MKILTAEQMREADRLTSERYGIPSLQLMENAGAASPIIWSDTTPIWPRATSLILCGKGNNGGDGLVVARRLREAGAAPARHPFRRTRGDARRRGDESAALAAAGSGELRVVTSRRHGTSPAAFSMKRTSSWTRCWAPA